MTPYYDDGQARFYHGDVLDVLAQLPDASVQAVVTSPPYWGLRDYGQAGQLGLEPTPEEYVFPSELPRRCILAGSREGDTVLDPFLGSGTTAMVAKSLGRRAIGIDLSETYLSLAVRRCRQLGLFTLEGSR